MRKKRAFRIFLRVLGTMEWELDAIATRPQTYDPASDVISVSSSLPTDESNQVKFGLTQRQKRVRISVKFRRIWLNKAGYKIHGYCSHV